MSNYHILDGRADGNQYRAIFHIPVPDESSDSGISLRTALSEHTGGNVQSAVPSLEATEQTALNDGALYEHQWKFDTHPGLTLAQKRDILDAEFISLSANISNILHERLACWGFSRDVPEWIDLIDDPYAVLEKPSIPRPNYLEPITDPVFGTKVTRITGDPGDPVAGGIWGTVARHWYSRVQPWNANESLIYLYFNEGGSPVGGLLLNGETYEPIKFLNPPTLRTRWHPVYPEMMVYAVSNEIGYFDTNTGQKTILRTFPGYTFSNGFMGKGELSFDGKMSVLHGYKEGRLYIFAYDLENDIVYPELNVDNFIAYGQTWTCFAWASISPSGQYIYIHYHNTWQQVRDLNMSLITTLGYPMNHAALGVDENGDDVALGGAAGWYICDQGTVFINGSGLKLQLVKQRLLGGTTTQLTWGNDHALSHTSARNSERPGWVYNWFPGYQDSVFRDEIIAISTNGGGGIQRFCHLHNIKTDYYSEAHPVPSHDGRRVLFASNWDEPSGRPMGAYVVDARR